jgi:hypothetical protein
LFFPGPAFARNGAWEVRDAARALNCSVIVFKGGESKNFWTGISLRTVERNAWRDASFWSGIAAVVQPSLGETAPRVQLAALEAGVPVIAGENCGLEAEENLHCVPFGESDACLATLRAALEGRSNSTVPG